VRLRVRGSPPPSPPLFPVNLLSFLKPSYARTYTNTGEKSRVPNGRDADTFNDPSRVIESSPPLPADRVCVYLKSFKINSRPVAQWSWVLGKDRCPRTDSWTGNEFHVRVWYFIVYFFHPKTGCGRLFWYSRNKLSSPVHCYSYYRYGMARKAVIISASLTLRNSRTFARTFFK
jgi:hypothetical protein